MGGTINSKAPKALLSTSIIGTNIGELVIEPRTGLLRHFSPGRTYSAIIMYDLTLDRPKFNPNGDNLRNGVLPFEVEAVQTNEGIEFCPKNRVEISGWLARKTQLEREAQGYNQDYVNVIVYGDSN